MKIPAFGRFLLIGLGWLGLAESQAHAASPALASVRPVGGQRGTEVEVILGGDRLGDAREILFYQDGITTKKLEPIDAKQVKATLAIAADCPLGIHDIRVRTATGLSALRTFSVGAYPETGEVEPNNEFAKPQPIKFGSVVNGVAGNEDVDYYAFEAKKGDRITAEVEGARLGITTFDPYVAIMDAKRFELTASDDAALIWQDAFASVIAPADGTYIIQVRETSYNGNGSCLYRLHVGNYPRPRAIIPAGGKLGDTLQVRWIGDILGDRTTTVTLPSVPARDFGLLAQDDLGSAPHPNAFRLTTFGNVIEAEPNDAPADATKFEAPLALNGAIEKAGDVDHFVFAAKKGQTLDIRVHARTIRSPLDSVLTIAKKGGGNLASNDDARNSPDSNIRFAVPDDGEYVIGITDHLRKGGPEYFYRIEVAPITARLGLSLPEESLVRGIGPTQVSVPRGSRHAIVVNARRVEFNGAINIGVDGLPAGMAAEVDPVANGQTSFPILFTATPQAEPAGALVAIEGKPADPAAPPVPTDLRQSNEMTLGQNNVPYWSRYVDRLAVAVTDEAPFTIEVVEPKVPLVRGGSMGLKVVARRKEGFKAPIALSLPWVPPGVSASGGVSIPEGADSAEIPVNADGSAEFKTNRVVVNGQADTATGPLVVSSQLAKITVAAQFLTLAFPPTSVEQGKEVDYVVAVNQAVPFAGEAKVSLIGLPNKVTTEPATVTKDTKEVTFKLKTDPASPAGNHQNLFCQVVIVQDGEPILHNLGSGQLRIDAPLPPKPAPAAPVAAAAPPPPAAPAAPAEKRVSRLEKLRQESRERAAAAAAAPPAQP
ncbi:PPC domain-containing protein [Tundrisphaera sp. TA3]|uniref:PPC domain-containing protein n=1 Tax=Tundrisphaera sp. TA3 TaxID=3435775 RepID=UPI003EBB6E30